MPDFSKCIRYRGVVYCRTPKGGVVEINVKNVNYNECPACVLKALLADEVPETVDLDFVIKDLGE
jgi:hypothetical protein